MANDQKAYWIWHPGEYEFMLGLNLHAQRFERGGQQTPIWKMEPMFPDAKFYKKVSVPEKTKFTIYAQGEVNVSIRDEHAEPYTTWGSFYQDFRNGVVLEPGEYTLFISVCNPNGLPCIYIDSEYVKTGPDWEVDSTGYPKTSVDCWLFDSPDNPPSDNFMAEKRMDPVSVERTEYGILYDFGKEMMSRPVMKGIKGNTIESGKTAAKRDALAYTPDYQSYWSKAHAGNPGSIRLIYGESKEEALDFTEADIWDFPGIDGDHYEANSPRAFRYIHVIGGDDLDIEEMYAMYVYLPIENKARFHSSEEKLNRIYDVALYTLHLNSREFFLDGIKRDRWVWSGDATQSYLLNYYTFFDNPLCKRTMRMLAGKEPTTSHLNTIIDYTSYWFVSLYDYYLYTGDLDFIRQTYRRATELMAFCEKRRDERGFMISPPDEWVFVDWAPINNSSDVSFIQLLYMRSLEVLAKMADLCGHHDDAKKYQADFEQTRDCFWKTFWNEEKGCFVHGWDRDKKCYTHYGDDENNIVTRYTNMFSIFFGYLTPEQTESVKKVLLDPEVLEITTPYMKFYELMALCEIGDFDTVTGYIRSYWGGMLDLGATSIWETYDPSQSGIEHYAMYGRKYGKSLCHAWGAGPTLLFGKYYLGVRPTAPGYAEFDICPERGGIESIDGSVPTPTGNVEVTIDASHVTVVNHSEGIGTLKLAGHEDRKVAPGETVTTEL